MEGRAKLWHLALGSEFAGFKLYSYEPGTTTPKTVWADADKGHPYTNPVLADSNGWMVIYGDGDYRFEVLSSDGTLMRVFDPIRVTDDVAHLWEGSSGTNVPSRNDNAVGHSFIKLDGNNNFAGFYVNSDGNYVNMTSAITTGFLSVKDFGASGGGLADDSAAVESTITAAMSSGQAVWFPNGTYYCPSIASFAITSNVSLIGLDGTRPTIKQGKPTPSATADIMFDCSASLRVSGLNFEQCGTVAFYSNNLNLIDYIDISDCRFTSCGSPLYWNNGAERAGVTHLACHDNEVVDCDRGFFVGAQVISDADISHNKIKNVVRKGIKIGLTNTVDQQVNNIRVIGNYIDGVSDPSGVSGAFDCNAIDVQGNYCAITGNTVHDVTTGNKDNSEGIYTKVHRGVIAHNVLVDAGENQGYINIKGAGLDSPGELSGARMIVSHNVLHNVLNTGAAGIHIETDDVLVEGNILHGFDGRGITTPDEATKRYDNITIRGNKISGSTGSGVIGIFHNGVGVVIEGNHIDGCDGSTTSTTPTFGISVAPRPSPGIGLTQVRIRNNIINGLTATDSRGIWLTKSTTTTFADVIIEGNSIDGAQDGGIALSGDSPIQDLRIRGNYIANVTDANRDIVITASAAYSGAGLVIDGNFGDFVNENQGAVVVAASTETVTHGLSLVAALSLAPTAADIVITPTNAAAANASWYIDNINDTTFDVTGFAVSDTFAWRIRRTKWST